MYKVAVITRTRDRVRFLRRALLSIRSQTSRDFIWVIVNDGGEREPVEEIVRETTALGITTAVFHLSHSRGMEAASNVGIMKSDSEYIVIHDDDDSWHPDFLSSTVSFLESAQGKRYGGVVTLTMSVEEELSNDGFKTLKAEPFNPGLDAVYLAEIAKGNCFPPISFLFRRSAYVVTGPYDETLPVRGDWDFNLRFLTEFDIGVIPRYLANYHRRRQAGGPYSNSVVEQANLHREYDAIIRNRYLRKDIKDHSIGLGFLLNLGQQRQIFLKKNRKRNILRRFFFRK